MPFKDIPAETTRPLTGSIKYLVTFHSLGAELSAQECLKEFIQVTGAIKHPVYEFHKNQSHLNIVPSVNQENSLSGKDGMMASHWVKSIMLVNLGFWFSKNYLAVSLQWPYSRLLIALLILPQMLSLAKDTVRFTIQPSIWAPGHFF